MQAVFCAASQILKVQLQIHGTHIYTCANNLALRRMLPLDTVSQIEEKMLPFTKEWQAARSAVKSVNTAHPIDASTGLPLYDSCELQVRCRFPAAANCPPLPKSLVPPATHDYVESPASRADPHSRIVLAHPRSCPLVPPQVVIQRNFLVYLMKSMVTTVLVVMGSLLTACFMHPEENIGDRFAVLFIAFLILITNMQTVCKPSV